MDIYIYGTISIGAGDNVLSPVSLLLLLEAITVVEAAAAATMSTQIPAICNTYLRLCQSNAFLTSYIRTLERSSQKEICTHIDHELCIVVKLTPSSSRSTSEVYLQLV